MDGLIFDYTSLLKLVEDMDLKTLEDIEKKESSYKGSSSNRNFISRPQEVNPLKFNNFEAREYDYDSLEKKLLGWDKDD